MNILAEELNRTLSDSVAYGFLSPVGRRMYFPKGIVAQSDEQAEEPVDEQKPGDDQKPGDNVKPGDDASDGLAGTGDASLPVAGVAVAAVLAVAVAVIVRLRTRRD